MSGEEGRAREIVQQLLQLPVDRRADEAARVCGDDEALRDLVMAHLEVEGVPTVSASPQNCDDIDARGDHEQLPRIELPDYRLIRKLGKGTFGTVWLAQNVHDQQFCAVKLVHAAHANVELDGIREFKRCAQRHPNLMPIEHVGRADQVYYVVMPLADDAKARSINSIEEYEPTTLASYFDRHAPLRSEDLFEIGLELLEGVAALHDAGAIHRDIKPANVLRMGGTWRLGDPSLITRFGAPPGAGSRGFVPPEGAVDRSADLWAIGTTLYFAATGWGLHRIDEYLVGRPTDTITGELFRELIAKSRDSVPADRFKAAQQMMKELRELRATQLRSDQPNPEIEMPDTSHDHADLEAGIETTGCEDSAHLEITRLADDHLSIPGYRVFGKIGSGGSADVYRAEQVQPFRRPVAVKVLRSTKVGPRYLAEAQAHAVLEHRSIGRIYDAGLLKDGRVFVVMELVSGTSINAFCDEHRLTLEDRAGLLAEACFAIHHANERGVAHANVKPHNIQVALVGGEPSLKVLGFGLTATMQALFSGDEPEGLVAGTPAYMAPEQLSGKRDVRSDVFAMGIVAFELLSGVRGRDSKGHVSGMVDWIKRPIGLPSDALRSTPSLHEICACRRVNPVELLQAMRTDVDPIVGKALQPLPDGRYQTMQTMGQDLSAYANGARSSQRKSTWIQLSRIVSSFLRGRGSASSSQPTADPDDGTD